MKSEWDEIVEQLNGLYDRAYVEAHTALSKGKLELAMLQIILGELQLIKATLIKIMEKERSACAGTQTDQGDR